MQSMQTLPYRKLINALLVYCLPTVMIGCANDSGIRANVTAIEPTSSDLSQLHLDGNGNWPDSNWIAQFHDPQLERLVSEALAQNPDMQIAQARVLAAQAKAEEYGSARGFSGQANAQISRARLPVAIEPFNANVAGNNLPVDVSINPWATPTGLLAGVNYEFDLWGKKEALQQALKSEQMATALDSEQARLTLTTTLVKLYFQYDYYVAMSDLLKEQIRTYGSIEELADARVNQGLDGDYDRSDTQLKRSALLTQQLTNEQNVTLTQLQLGLLAGAGPDRGFKLQRPALAATSDAVLPAQLPANLLGRRPDIIAARLRIEALQAKAESTRASFYPDINLSALTGLMTTDVASLLSSDAIFASFGPAISLPIFDRGRIRARLKADYANADMAISQYNKTVNQAFGDIVQQLTSISSTDSIIEQQTRAVAAAARIVEIAKTRHERGIGPNKAIMLAKLSMAAETQKLLTLRAQRRTLQVELVRALGGGFSAGQYANVSKPSSSAQSNVARPTP
ncbi:MAG: transporter [Verrucomicrobiaceae bacterium]|nr:transporter [Verrucomicrobiaceae bacterium]